MRSERRFPVAKVAVGSLLALLGAGSLAAATYYQDVAKALDAATRESIEIKLFPLIGGGATLFGIGVFLIMAEIARHRKNV